MLSKKIFIISLFVLGILIFCNSVNAVDTGALNPSATGGYKNEWSNPTRAYTQDDTNFAVATSSTADEQDYYNFGFSLTEPVKSVDGIKVEVDTYSSYSNMVMYCKLSWNTKVTWTSEKNANIVPTSDTDTYLVLGSSSDTWGRTWVSSEFANSKFYACFRIYHALSGRSVGIDHIRITVYYTICTVAGDVSEFKGYNIGCNSSLELQWTEGVNTETTRIQYAMDTFPDSISDGTNLCNTSEGHYYFYDLNPNDRYYFSAWGFDTDCKDWSNNFVLFYFDTPCSNNITIYNNTAHTVNKYGTSYDSLTGWYIWLNYTGQIPTITKYENIVDATGTHESQWSLTNWLFKVWANYTGINQEIHTPDICDWYTLNYDATGDAENVSWSTTDTCWIDDDGIGVINITLDLNPNTPILTLYENILNATGTHEISIYKILNSWYWDVYANYTGNGSGCPPCNSTGLLINNNNINVSGSYGSSYNNVTGWELWLNYTGLTTPIHLLENLLNVTGTHEYFLNDTGYYVFANYTGIGGVCPSDLYYFNYSDENITINVTVNCSALTNTSNYTINDNNWLNMASAIMLDNSQLFLFILLSLWIYFVSKYLVRRTSVALALAQFLIMIPLNIIFISISFAYPFGFALVFIIPVISIYFVADALFYNKHKED